MNMCNRKSFPFFWALFTLAGWLAGPTGLWSQVIVNPFPCNGPTRLPDACMHHGYEVRFQTDGPIATDWQVINLEGCQDFGFLFPQSNVPVMKSISAGNGSSGLLDLCVQAKFSGVPVSQTFSINVKNCPYDVQAAPCKWDIAFVLDNSVTMALPSGATGPPTRWEKILDMFSTSGANYIQTMAAAAGLGADDRWAVFFYGNDNVVHDPLIHRGDFGAALSAATWPSPVGNSPMGGGLQEALQDFFSTSTPGTGRAVFLMSDGAQNRNPRVKVMPSTNSPDFEFEIKEDLFWDPNPPVNGLGTGLGQLPIQKRLFLTNNIHLFSVGLGLGRAPGTDLERMSEEFVNAANSTDLPLFFNATIPDIFKGASPRILNAWKDTVPAQGKKERRFVVNRQVSNVTIQFLADDYQQFNLADLQVDILKNDVALYGNADTTNRRLLLYDFDFPETSDVSPVGEWVIRYGDSEPVPCLTTVFADDKALKYSLDVQGDKHFVAGDEIPVRLSLHYRDSAVLNARVTATLVQPAIDLGDYVSKIDLPGDTSGQYSADLTPGEYKISYAQTTPPHKQALAKEVNREIELTDQGNGLYTGNFTSTNVTGGYRIVTRMEGLLPNGDRFEGWDLEGGFLDFARPDDIDLNGELIEGSKTADGQAYTLKVAPVNRFGHKIGPAQEDYIYVDLTAGAVGKVTDNLDGSYSIPLVLPPKGGTTLRVAVLDPNNILLEQCLGCQRWSLSAHAGTSFPFSHLDSLYNSGVAAEIDIRYRFSRNLALELVGGYYGFQPGFNIAGGTLFGEYSLPGLIGEGWGAHLAAGPGLFKPKQENTAWGIGLRAGVSKQLSSRWESTLDWSWFRLPDAGYSFAALQLGVHYNF